MEGSVYEAFVRIWCTVLKTSNLGYVVRKYGGKEKNLTAMNVMWRAAPCFKTESQLDIGIDLKFSMCSDLGVLYGEVSYGCMGTWNVDHW